MPEKKVKIEEVTTSLKDFVRRRNEGGEIRAEELYRGEMKLKKLPATWDFVWIRFPNWGGWRGDSDDSDCYGFSEISIEMRARRNLEFRKI